MSSKQIRSGAKAPGHRRHIVGRLMGYIKRGYKARFIIVLVCILVSAIANVAGSLFLGSLIDDYITPLLGAADPDFSGLVRALVMMGCLFLVGALCAYAYNRNMIVVSQGVQKTIRDDLFGHMQTLPIKYFDTHAHGDVMSVYTNDVDTLRQMFAQSIPQVINSSMTILVTFLGMLFTNALLTGCVLVCVCFALVVTRFLAGRSGRYFLRQQSTLGALNGYIEEMINGQKVVKVFCHEQEAQDGFDRVNDEMFHSADKGPHLRQHPDAYHGEHRQCPVRDRGYGGRRSGPQPGWTPPSPWALLPASCSCPRAFPTPSTRSPSSSTPSSWPWPARSGSSP